MIIMGYPGIGKSTVAKTDYRFIDLDSSTFKDIPNWAKYYTTVAEGLSHQGYYVFVSTHAEVRNRLYGSKEKVALCYPDGSIKEEWIEKLRKRYEKDRSKKNALALKHVEEHFDEDFERMSISPHKKILIPTMEYNLAKMVVDYFDGLK